MRSRPSYKINAEIEHTYYHSHFSFSLRAIETLIREPYDIKPPRQRIALISIARTMLNMRGAEDFEHTVDTGKESNNICRVCSGYQIDANLHTNTLMSVCFD